MTSLFPEYEYDIFISYRQKDNKGDRWVSEFVEALKTELESTFKEEISVYFDINPHDGLLETYDVDESLKDKLKCLVFIPIISRTYCDPKSFAWENEFKAFINQASQDQFGLKVKLLNGNVATRILPIQIHDLHPEDKSLLEKALGGVLRAIEFIYKEPGVNKPLTADDDEKKNLNGTKYRIQINKVSNTIDEIIQSLKGKNPSSIDGRVSSDQPYHDKEEAKGRKLSGMTVINQKSKQWLVILLLVVLCGAVAFAAYKIIKGSEKANDIANLEKSIAVLPFINDSPEKENEYIWNGMMEEVISKLQKVKDFRVLSRTSTTQYNRPERPTVSDIAKKLRVNYIIEGSGQKYGNKIRLIVQLIGANGKENHLWAQSYDMELKDATEVFNIQSMIAQSIVTELKAVITPEEKLIIDRVPTTSLKAYDYYQRGKEEIWKFGTGSINKESIERAESLFKKSLEYDSTFARGYVGLAEVIWKKVSYKENENYFKQYMDSMFLLANKALSFDNNTDDAYIVRAGYYAEGRNDLNKAIEELDEALKINPNFWLAYQEKAKYYWWQNDLAKEIDNRYNASLLNHGDELPELLTTLGDAFVRAGFPDMANDYYLEALNLDGDSTKYLSLLARKELFLGKIEKSKELLDKISIRDTDYSNQSIAFNLNANFVSYYLYAHQLEKALKYINKLKYSGQVNQHLKNLTFNQVTYLYWINAFWKLQDDNYANILEWRYKLITKPDFLSYIADDDYLALAFIYSIKGDKEKAIKFLQRFNQNTSRFDLSTVTILKNDPSLDNIRNDPEFQKIVNDVESKYKAEHERVSKWLQENKML